MKWLIAVGMGIFVATSIGTSVHAEAALQVQPLQREATLQKGERKQGFVDVYNPQSRTIDVSFRIQGFRQVDERGNLTFYDDQQLSQGVELSLASAQIPAHKTLRLVFIADGAKLPTGDVFAVIFAQVKPDAVSGANATVQLGSLLILTNQTPGARLAAVKEFDLNWLQVGTGVQATAIIANTAPTGTASGFFPTVTLTAWPFGPSWQIRGPLVQAGNSRTVVINEPTDQFGVYRVRVAVGNSSQERWAVFITGYWRWLIFVIGFVVAAAIVLLIWLHRNRPHLIARKR